MTTASRLRGAAERFLSPGLGRCLRCNRPWMFPATRLRWANEGEWKLHRLPWRGRRTISLQLDRRRFFGCVGVELHSTTYEFGLGCFPLCEGCWSALSPLERLPYYDALVDGWIRVTPSVAADYDRRRELIREAVIAGG